jgi:hypothetical protein
MTSEEKHLQTVGLIKDSFHWFYACIWLVAALVFVRPYFKPEEQPFWIVLLLFTVFYGIFKWVLGVWYMFEGHVNVVELYRLRHLPSQSTRFFRNDRPIG